MIVRSKNFELKIEEILKAHLPAERYSDTENFVLMLIQKWHSGAKEFLHHTSGSTGKPKAITIPRKKIELSAEATFSYMDANKTIRNALLCISPKTIGGAMVVYRSLIYHLDLTLVEPTVSFLKNLPEENFFDLVSMVPIQFNIMQANDLARFKNVLVGGAAMPVLNLETETRVYATYGMTETVSHIALRPIGERLFHTLGDIKVALTERETLKIKGSITDNKWMETNDLSRVYSDTTFEWIGRADFIINTGGIKVNPESVEAALLTQIRDSYVVTWLPDPKLGQQVVLLTDGDPKRLDFSGIEKYHRPKQVFFNQTIYKTRGGKVDRNKTQQAFARKYLLGMQG